MILYTSGTTGTPKGAELTHANLRSNVEVSAALFDLDDGRRDARRAAAVPLLRPDVRAERDDRRRRHADADPALRPGQGAGDHRARQGHGLRGRADDVRARCSTTPTRDDVDTSSLRVCVSGGAAMPVEVMRGFEEKFGCKVLEGYGLSRDLAGRLVQPPRQGAQARLDRHADRGRRDEGRRRRRQGGRRRARSARSSSSGHNVMKGYWNKRRRDRGGDRRTAGSTPATWPRSTRTATSSSSTARRSMIIRGGYNVYPREIEEVLYEHPAVREAAVIGVPHDELGEEVGAAVALKDGEDVRRGDAARLRQGARSRPTSTRARSGSSTSCPRARPARSSSARSRSRRRPSRRPSSW